MHYYSRDLALVHDRGFGQHADRCAPGILELPSPVSGGLVLELGCGSGTLTRHLLVTTVIAAPSREPPAPSWAGSMAKPLPWPKIGRSSPLSVTGIVYV
jgi:hypothetical protein